MTQATLQDALTAIDTRHTMTNDEISICCRDNFSGSMLSLKQLEPVIRDVQRRFKILGRKQHMDGSYPNIFGYRSFGSIHDKEEYKKVLRVGWCEGVLKFDVRTVHYMLNGGNKKKKSKPKKEKLSAPQASEVLKYVEEHASEMSSEQRRMLMDGLAKFLQRTK